MSRRIADFLEYFSMASLLITLISGMVLGSGVSAAARGIFLFLVAVTFFFRLVDAVGWPLADRPEPALDSAPPPAGSRGSANDSRCPILFAQGGLGGG